MKRTLLVLALLVPAFAHADWRGKDASTVGVDSGKAQLDLTIVTNENQPTDKGIALYYYPALQPKTCDYTTGVFETFDVNGEKVEFKKFCINGGSMPVAYTPSTFQEAGKVIDLLTKEPNVVIQGVPFTTRGFAKQVEVLLGQ